MKKIFLIFAFIGLFVGVLEVSNAAAQKKAVWNGVWNVPSRYQPSTLTIKPLAAGKFEFTIDAANGGNTGEVSGVAVIKGSKAYFDDRKSGRKASETYGCKLTFTHKGKLIAIDSNSGCDSYGGYGVNFANNYYKGNPKVREDSFVYLKVFPDRALDQKFKALVGDKSYEQFLNSFQLGSEDEDLDGLGAKVFSACVRGLCSFYAAIIMYDKQGNFWAVVLDDSSDDDALFANYYTNAAAWTDKMPKTIEKFVNEKRELNRNFSVVYKNKK